jgi:simple sugar transport system substrate-binding protein
MKSHIMNSLLAVSLMIAVAVLVTACATANTALSPASATPTRHPTFTPLVVDKAVPLPTQPLPPATLETVQSRGNPSNSSTYSGPEPSLLPLHFIFVQHARCAWDPFWCPVEQGIQDAAHDLGVKATIVGPDSLNLDETAALIDGAVTAKPDGIALTVSDPTVLREPILRAIASGIPVLAYNAGSGPIKDNLPYLTYLGMDDYLGGYVGAHRLMSAGAHQGACIIDAPVLAALQLRCKGFQDAFAEAGKHAEVLNTTKDVTEAQKDIQTFAESHPEVNAYLTSSLSSALPFYAYLKASEHKPGGILHGSFDLGPEITTNIENGTTLFGIDQQPYLQGYEAVFWLTMIDRYGLKPALPVIATGPRFIDNSNVGAKSNPERPIKLTLIHHGLCSWDAYWCVIDQGAYDAAKNMNVQLTVVGPESFDLNKMASQISDAVTAGPDALAVTVPDPKLLHEPILNAIQAGIPVVTYDSGFGPVKDNLPYLTFIGTDEYMGGYLAALRLINAGARAGICVDHQIGHAALDARCQGLMDAFQKQGLNAEVLDIGGDADKALTILTDYAQSHPEVNAFLTLGAVDPGAITFYNYLKATGRKPGELLHGTFDLSQAVVSNIENGTTLFAIDAQPYIQGYSAVMFLALYLRQNVWPAVPITPSGPAFVDQTNIGIVKQLAGKYR